MKLPVWELGLSILVPLVLAYGLRGPLSGRLVESASPCRQPRRQFFLEMGLIFSGGITSALILFFGYRIPFLQSGLKLLVGLFTVALFAGLDLALARERVLILGQLHGRVTYDPPTRFTPITRTFFLTATLILAFTAGIMMLVLVRDMNWLESQDVMGPAIAALNQTVILEVIFVMTFLLIMIVNLIYSYSRNLRLLFKNQTRVLENVSQGDLSSQVPVVTHNELGVIAGHTNTMIRALREGVRMREGLVIASEVQRHFLPDHAPNLPGLELAGTARFSDETGGDFFDFIECEQPGCTNHGVMVGDVSGHGIGAALLMAAGRALIRQSASIPAPCPSGCPQPTNTWPATCGRAAGSSPCSSWRLTTRGASVPGSMRANSRPCFTTRPRTNSPSSRGRTSPWAWSGIGCSTNTSWTCPTPARPWSYPRMGSGRP